VRIAEQDIRADEVDAMFFDVLEALFLFPFLLPWFMRSSLFC
jgi:hypothetical protein